MRTITISPQGQITIPIDLRRALNLKPGSTMILDVVDWVKSKVVVLRPTPKNWVDEVSGSGEGIWGKDSDKYLDELRNQW